MNRRRFLIGGGALALTGASATYFDYRKLTSMTEYNASAVETRRSLAERPDLSELIRYASLAASGHNTQPWKFRATDQQIEILPDFGRRTPVVDPDDHHLFVSLGCATENLTVAAQARGLYGDVHFDSKKDGVVRFTFKKGPVTQSTLFAAIPRRQSTRLEYDGRALSSADLKLLAKSALVDGVDLVLMTERSQIDRVRDLIVAGNTIQMNDPGFMKELKMWLRFNPQEALRTGDGLFSAASGSPIVPTWMGSHFIDWFFRAQTENDKYSRQLNSSSGLAIFISHQADHLHWVQAGRASQRFALQATALGLKHCFVNQPVEVEQMRPDLAALVGMPGRRPDLVMRFGYGPSLPFSARRPPGAILV